MSLASIGMPLLWIGVACAVTATVLFCYDSRNGSKPKLPLWSSAAYWTTAVVIICVCADLATLLLSHDFSVDYVYRYSSRELPPGYLFATFWAGQDGSFLLWAFWIAVLGVVLLQTTSLKFRSRTMTVYCPVLLFLLTILIIRNPFTPYVADPGMPLHPADGIGLNPLLENPWMVVHPPTLFLGFAGLTIPFVFALSSLIWGDDPDWYRRAWPWALFTFSVLGLGVMLGGYWAYETLGWGGFWGWDPVENGPLVPWLSTVALLHAIQVNRTRASLKKTTLCLALFGFVAALYETFLTRTGILDKFSNHSFSTLGGTANNVVLGGLLTATALSAILLVYRFRRIRNEIKVFDNATSKEFGLTLTVIILMACALIVAAGMSAPLLTGWAVAAHLMANQSSVSPDFFNKANFPEAVLLNIGMALGPFLAWSKSPARSFSPIWKGLILSVLMTVVYAYVGVTIEHVRLRPEMLLLFATCIVAIVSNVLMLTKGIGSSQARKTVSRTAGGVLSHIGAAFILLGIVGLVMFTHKESPFLAQGRAVKLSTLPYEITYEGMTSDLFHTNNQLKFSVSSDTGAHEFSVDMPFAVRNVEGTNQLLARPAISMRWWGDLYFAFENGPEILSPNDTTHFTLKRTETAVVNGYKVALLSYSVPPNIDAEVANNIVPQFYPVTARLKITDPQGNVRFVSVLNTRYKDDPIAPGMPETLVPTEAGNGVPEAIAFGGLDPDTAEASFYLRKADFPLFTAFTIEVSTRPTIGLVWIGTLLIFLGGLLSMFRRAADNRAVEIGKPAPSLPPLNTKNPRTAGKNKVKTAV